MSQDGHIKSLQHKKQILEKKLEEALAQPSTDSTLISQIKREKLRIKDELAKVSMG